ncbi:hypothetical protein ACWC5I_01105 [Kitasatospora sp. NPDC001574]
MSPRGRRASLPGSDARTERGLLTREDGRVLVRCFDQDERDHRDYDFTDLPVAAGLRDALVAAFVRRVAPGKGLRSLESTEKVHNLAVGFCRHLATLPWPPTEAAHLTPGHVDSFFESRSHLVSAIGELGALKKLLSRVEGLSDAMAGKLREAGPSQPPVESTKESYGRAELRRIAEAARQDLRQAAKRIRANREVLRQLRDGEIDAGGDRLLAKRLQLLDWVDRFADVPRCPPGGGSSKHRGKEWARSWVFEHGSVLEVVSWLHLTADETAAGAVLLAAMTGENPKVVLRTPAVHHRADGYTGQVGTAIVDLNKRRRGSRAHMSLALTEIPNWISVPGDPENLSSRDMLHTPFGVYLLLHELTSRSRELAGGQLLLVGYAATGGRGAGRGLRPLGTENNRIRLWADRHGLKADQLDEDGNPVPLRLTLDLLRLTYLELNQKPVAHTEQTLVDDYLGRNRGNLAEYQKVVAATLDDEVAKARVRGAIRLLTAEDVERARTDPQAVAAQYAVDATILQRMIAGELDTVMNACADNTGGHHAPVGQPCRASFMQCLECPCARALPRHLPVQVLVHDRLAERRSQVTPLQWAQRFAGPHAQLADILGQHGDVAADDARRDATDADRSLVERFLNRELDLR